MNPTEGPGSGGMSIRAGVFVMLLVGLLAASYDALNSSSPTFAANPQAQMAQAASPSTAAAAPTPTASSPAAASGGQCGQRYTQCMNDPSFPDKGVCETNWRICIQQVCVKKDTPTIDSCPKDPDCESSCTESATSQGGLLSCCDGGPQHNNQCRKKVDGKCTIATQGSDVLANGASPAGVRTITIQPEGYTPTTPTPAPGSPAGSNYILDDYGNTLKDSSGNPIPAGNNAALQAAVQQEQALNAANFPAQQPALMGDNGQPLNSNIRDDYGNLIPLQQGDSAALNSTVQQEQALNAANWPTNNTFAPPAAPAEPSEVGVPPTGNDTNPFGCPLGQPCNVPAPTPRPNPGQDLTTTPASAPNPDKPYYLQQVDENGKNVWCDQSGNCKSAGQFTPPPSQGGPPPGSKTPNVPGNGAGTADLGKSGSGSGSGLGSGLSSLLSGLAKGLGQALATQPPPAAPAAPAQVCSTDPNAYAQQQQQYQQQLQQYNYQLQQAQYQQQMQQYYAQQQGGYGYAPPPQQMLPTQPTPCSPSTQQQCSLQPQQPSPATCSNGSWQPIRSGNCIVNWQCSDLGAQLSCEPKTADVGMSLAISYSCAQGTASGNGFTASGQSGTTIATVAAPPQGTNTATYSLTCTSGTQTSGAQCSVQVTQPTIILVANPGTVHAGETSLIGWITRGMQACVISSPDDAAFTAQNASNTSVSGTATTLSATTTAGYLLHCQTLAGGTRDATTTVTVQ